MCIMSIGFVFNINPGPAKPGYSLPLQIMKKATDNLVCEFVSTMEW